jgi:hypothetical protein
VQADLAQMFKYDNFQYFLLVIDCFSSRIFVEPLKNKTSESVAKALQKIFKKFNTPIQEIQSDRGKEFLGQPCKTLFKDLKIVYRPKFGKNKANFAENAIGRVKRKLYMFLRTNLSKNWVSNIQKIVDGFNNTPAKKLGWLKPNEITSPLDTIRVKEAREKYHIKVYTEPSFEDQLKNQKAFLSSNDLKVKDFVYLNFEEKLFDKSFDTKVKQNGRK